MTQRRTFFPTFGCSRRMPGVSDMARGRYSSFLACPPSRGDMIRGPWARLSSFGLADIASRAGGRLRVGFRSRMEGILGT